MKEKETYLFYEQWERDAVNQLYADARVPIRHISLSTGTYSPMNGRRFVPLPKATRDWIAANPAPKQSQREFLVSLAHRVESLEAALAEKGGSR